MEEEVKKHRGRPKGSKNKKGLGHKNKGYTVSEKVLAQRKQASPLRSIKTNPTTDEEKEYNARLIDHIMQINAIRENADRNDLLSLRSCFIAYLKLCQQNGFNVTNLSAYASMGMNYDEFKYFAKKDDPEIREFCRWVREVCAMFRENMVANNKLNPVIGIFWQRNFDGLRNDTEQVQAAQEMEDDSYDRNGSYKDKYKKLIGGE